jgi:multidrug transporter EmrE-like cation transporter
MRDTLHPIRWLFLLLSLFCQASAMVLGKYAALRMGAATATAFVTNPYYLAGLGCLVLQAFFWQVVVRGFRLFVAYLFTSLNYLLVLAASRVLFREHVTVSNIAGAAVIIAGVYFVVREDLP